MTISLIVMTLMCNSEVIMLGQFDASHSEGSKCYKDIRISLGWTQLKFFIEISTFELNQ